MGCSAHPIPAAIDKNLNQLETNGITLTLSDILSAGATLFKTTQQPSSNADVTLALNVLQRWQISVQYDVTTGNNRLISVPPQNDSIQRTGTELLGVGVNLLVASRVYGVYLNDWEITTGNARFDYTATYPPTNSPVEVEVRARLDRNSWPDAVQKSKDKLTSRASLSTRDFAVAATLLVALRSELPKRALRRKDILIMDPPGDNTIRSGSQRLRSIMRHYIPFFERQQGLNENNFTRRFAQRLRDLASSDEEAFQHYLRAGDTALRYDKRGEKPWRTFFRYGGERFCGTAFYGYAWPAEIAGKKPEVGVGAYYFGLWEPIIEALRDGRIGELVELEVTPGTTEYNGKLFVLQSDGIALAWTASEAELHPGMFDDLPGSSLQAHSQEKEPALIAESGSPRYKAK